jgi:hypothetical protein
MIEWIIWGIIAAVVADVILNWDTVRDWISERLIRRDDYASLIQEKLANGKVRVRAGVFSVSGDRREVQSWECEKLDDELAQRFGNRSEVRITL